MTLRTIRRLSRWLAPLAATLFMGACTTLGPDYEEPRADWLKDWDRTLHGLVTGEGGDLPDLSFWWRTFNDPVLNRLIEQARLNNPDLRIAALRIFESRALLGIAGSYLYPQSQQINGGASHNRRNAPDDASDGSFNTYQAGFNVAWEMDFWGRFRRGIESAESAFFASQENQRAVQVLINAQIVDLYYSYRVTEARIDIARKNAKIQERSYRITEGQFNSGNTSELDVRQARTQYLATLLKWFGANEADLRAVLLDYGNFDTAALDLGFL